MEAINLVIVEVSGGLVTEVYAFTFSLRSHFHVTLIAAKPLRPMCNGMGRGYHAVNNNCNGNVVDTGFA